MKRKKSSVPASSAKAVSKTASSKGTSVKKDVSPTAKKVIAVVVLTVWLIFMVFMTCYIALAAVPAGSIAIYKFTGVPMAADVTISTFSMGDLVVLLMTWGLPSLALTLFVTFGWLRLCVFVTKRAIRGVRRAFAKENRSEKDD